MRKLKLDTLQVESFTTGMANGRGTVEAHSIISGCQCTYAASCGETAYVDCTYGCGTQLCTQACSETCPGNCGGPETRTCPV